MSGDTSIVIQDGGDTVVIVQNEPDTTVVLSMEGAPGLQGRNAVTDVVFAFDGKPGAGHASAAYPVGRATTYNPALCVGDAIDPPAATTVYPIMNRAVQVGAVTYQPNGVHTVALSPPTFGPGDLLYVVSANPADAQLSGPCLRLVEA